MLKKSIDLLEKLYPYAHQLPRRTMDEKLCFMHIPKCGGTSVDEACQVSYGISKRILGNRLLRLDESASLKASEIAEENLMDLRNKLLMYYLSKHECNYVSGHFTYDEDTFRHFGHEWNFMTILRNPVSKWFSQYFYNRFKDNNHFRIDSDIETFIESQRGVFYGCDYVVKFTNSSSVEEASTDQAISQAVKNLNEKFTLVGILERLDLFQRAFRERFNVDLWIRKRNANPLKKARQDEMISDEIYKRVEAICQPNIRVYEAILKQVLNDSACTVEEEARVPQLKSLPG